ncbi:NnrS family protein [Bradyrhizobium sp. G127]|uniref:NnrS family protein n=1 Tax=Bradyrhizobium sp. G127 TaxID=2904800 RepID=UPI001F268C6E|nr:NnrS family protein [Bradyrhizobium sp. G127]MCF2524661.1 NnrS family protein [Bradyrhizobium sp. G127]
MTAQHTPVPRLRRYQGPAVLSYGFRPFFLLGAAYAGLAILAWLPMFLGELTLRTAFVPRDWHVHEMLYGYLPAVITGFLFTAIPNWTGRLPIQGAPLLALVVVWVLGRFAVTCSAQIGWFAAMLIDISFLTLIAAAAGREIFAGRNWGNLKVVALIALLLVGNIAFHLEAHFAGAADYGIRAGIAVVVLLILLIGGRIVPSFTRNWLVRENPGRLPSPFARFDMAIVILSAAALLVWVVRQDGLLVGILLTLMAVLHIIRLGRWAGDRTSRERLVLILHIGYAFIPAGFLLAAAAALDFVPPSAGIHAWMAGAAGVMTLAVMTRASLGHTGQQLVASPTTQGIYVAIVIAALARICAVIVPAWSGPLLHMAAFAWAAAFLGFAVCFGPALMSEKRH